MGLKETDAVKAKGNWKSEKSKESENKRKKKKNNNNGDDNSRYDEEEAEGEASGCWVKFRFMIGCVPSKSDLDASSSSIYGNTSTGNFNSIKISDFFNFLVSENLSIEKEMVFECRLCYKSPSFLL